MTTGREWLEATRIAMRQTKHSDPDTHEALRVMRELLLDTVAAGDVNLSESLLVTVDDGMCRFMNEASA